MGSQRHSKQNLREPAELGIAAGERACASAGEPAALPYLEEVDERPIPEETERGQVSGKCRRQRRVSASRQRIAGTAAQGSSSLVRRCSGEMGFAAAAAWGGSFCSVHSGLQGGGVVYRGLTGWRGRLQGAYRVERFIETIHVNLYRVRTMNSMSSLSFCETRVRLVSLPQSARSTRNF